MNIKFW